MTTAAGREAQVGSWFLRLATDSVEGSDSLWSVLGVARGAESICSWERFLELFDPADRNRLTELCHGDTASEAGETVFRIVGGDDETRVIRIQARTVFDIDGQPEGILGIALHVAEGMDIDRQMAHELRNQIMVVLGNLDLIQMSATGQTKLARYVELALQSAERCVELTERMLGRSRSNESCHHD
jgi:signal transduction histidine kinase